jgi:hypothetical protein
MQIFHWFSHNQRLLGVVKNMSESIHAHLKVAGVDSHGLFTHCTLIGVSRGLVVVRERDDGGTHS